VTGDDTVLAGFVAQDPYAKIVGAPLTSEPSTLGEFASRITGSSDLYQEDGRQPIASGEMRIGWVPWRHDDHAHPARHVQV